MKFKNISILFLGIAIGIGSYSIYDKKNLIQNEKKEVIVSKECEKECETKIVKYNKFIASKCEIINSFEDHKKAYYKEEPKKENYSDEFNNHLPEILIENIDCRSKNCFEELIENETDEEPLNYGTDEESLNRDQEVSRAISKAKKNYYKNMIARLNELNNPKKAGDMEKRINRLYEEKICGYSTRRFDEECTKIGYCNENMRNAIDESSREFCRALINTYDKIPLTDEEAIKDIKLGWSLKIYNNEILELYEHKMTVEKISQMCGNKSYK